MIANNWEKIFDTSFEHRAEIVCEYLKQMGIEAVILNKQDSVYHFGKYQVHVPANKAVEATEILQNEIYFE